jgi:hypothetical protein
MVEKRVFGQFSSGDLPSPVELIDYLDIPLPSALHSGSDMQNAERRHGDMAENIGVRNAWNYQPEKRSRGIRLKIHSIFHSVIQKKVITWFESTIIIGGCQTIMAVDLQGVRVYNPFPQAG